MKALNIKALGFALTLTLCLGVLQPDSSFIRSAFALRATEEIDLDKAIACPRCRRAEPKGPKKRPEPGFHDPRATLSHFQEHEYV